MDTARLGSRLAASVVLQRLPGAGPRLASGHVVDKVGERLFEFWSIAQKVV
jgi:hypothetical protein